jgi:hypothetical protein
MTALHNRDAVIPTTMRSSVTPIRHRSAIEAVWIPVLVHLLAAAVLAVLKQVTAVVCYTLRSTKGVSANRNADLSGLSGTPKCKSGNSTKGNPLPIEAHKNPPHRAELVLSHPLLKRMG